ncbi:MAG TPA: hypothetical protein VKZ63_00605, partial [Kofleriaceae bacterium]|nr:hypothetical protein [Kofleriaceae bacterium]
MRATSSMAPLLAIALAACGGGQGGGAEADAPVAAPPGEECRAGDVAACLADARGACGGEHAGRRLRYGGLPPLAIGPAGLVAVEHLGGRWISTDATRWLACYEECPGGGGGRICFPLVTPLRVSWSAATGCDERAEPAPPWRGMASEVTVLSCPDGESRLRRVPELDPVRRDLVRAGVIEEQDALARLDGLVVEMSAGGAIDSALEEIGPADCSAFDL